MGAGTLSRLLSGNRTSKVSLEFLVPRLQARNYAGQVDEVSVGPHQMRKIAASYSAIMMASSPVLERTPIDRMGCASLTIFKYFKYFKYFVISETLFKM